MQGTSRQPSFVNWQQKNIFSRMTQTNWNNRFQHKNRFGDSWQYEWQCEAVILATRPSPTWVDLKEPKRHQAKKQ